MRRPGSDCSEGSDWASRQGTFRTSHWLKKTGRPFLQKARTTSVAKGQYNVWIAWASSKVPKNRVFSPFFPSKFCFSNRVICLTIIKYCLSRRRGGGGDSRSSSLKCALDWRFLYKKLKATNQAKKIVWKKTKKNRGKTQDFLLSGQSYGVRPDDRHIATPTTQLFAFLWLDFNFI